MAFRIMFQYTRIRLAGSPLTCYEEGWDLLEHLIHRESLILRRCCRHIEPHDQG